MKSKYLPPIFCLLLLSSGAATAGDFHWEMFLPALTTVPPPPTYTSVTMTCKRREWQRTDNGQEYCNVGDNIGHCSYDAQKYCADLTLDNHSDWYLPSRSEVQTLATCADQLPLPEGYFWTSTRDPFWPAGFSPHYFIVSLPSGGSSPGSGSGSSLGEGISYNALLKVLCAR